MEAIKVGLRGDRFRDARPVGFEMAVPLSLTAIKDGLRKNPLFDTFTLQVNQFSVDMAESIVDSFEGAVSIKIVSVPAFGKDEWLLTPET